MTGSTLLIATAAASTLFAGLLLALLPHLPALMAAHLKLPQARWFGGRAASAGGMVLLMLVSGPLVDKWGIRPVLLSALMTAALALALLERSRSALAALGASALFGGAAGAAVNAVVVLWPAVLTPHPAVAAADFGFAGFALMLFVTPGLALGLGKQIGAGRTLLVVALLGLVPAVLATFTPADDFPLPRVGPAWSGLGADLHLWMLAGAVVLYQLIEGSLPTWGGNYLQELGMSPGRLSVGVVTSAALWFGVGRVAAGVWVPADFAASFIVLLVVCLAILLGNTLSNDRPLSGAVGLVVAFACLGPLLPTILGLALDRYADGRATVAGLLLALNAATATALTPLNQPDAGPGGVRAARRLCISGVLLLGAVMLLFLLMR